MLNLRDDIDYKGDFAPRRAK